MGITEIFLSILQIHSSNHLTIIRGNKIVQGLSRFSFFFSMKILWMKYFILILLYFHIDRVLKFFESNTSFDSIIFLLSRLGKKRNRKIFTTFVFPSFVLLTDFYKRSFYINEYLFLAHSTVLTSLVDFSCCR